MFPKHPRNHQFGIDDHQFEFTVTFLLKKGSKSINSHIDGINLSTLMMTSIYLLTTHPVVECHNCDFSMCWVSCVCIVRGHGWFGWLGCLFLRSFEIKKKRERLYFFLSLFPFFWKTHPAKPATALPSGTHSIA